MKKIISIILTNIILSSICMVSVRATNDPGIITEHEAKQLAILFVANNIANVEMTWGENTKISDTITLYDENDKIIGYSVELCNGELSNGYVVISSNAYDENIIKEFSSKVEPLYKQAVSKSNSKVYNISPLEYYVRDNNGMKNLSGERIDKKVFRQAVQAKKDVSSSNQISIVLETERDVNYNVDVIRNQPFDITPFVTGGQGTSIYNPITWLKNQYSSTATWTNDGYGTLEPGITAFLQSNLEQGANNCSLTAIATVIYYYRHIKGYTTIDSEIGSIYATVRENAVARGYTADDGTDYNDIDNILTDTFSDYDCDIQGNNDYVSLWNTIKSEITNNWSPVIMSMTGGYYDNHTVTIVGWTQFKSSENNNVVRFLKVYDGWTTSNRYIDYEKITMIKNITKVIE